MRNSLIRVLMWALVAGAGLAGTPAMAAIPPTIQEFLSTPSTLLSDYPKGGPDMVQAVQNLVAADPSAINALVGLLPPTNVPPGPQQANADQSKAIGTALGRHAQKLVTSDPAGATQVQTKVVQSGNLVAMAAFDAEVGGNLKISAATTGIGGGAETSTTGNGTGFSVGGPSGLGLNTSAPGGPGVPGPSFTSGPGGSGPVGGPVSSF